MQLFDPDFSYLLYSYRLEKNKVTTAEGGLEMFRKIVRIPPL